jgi:hypothetical protein
VTLGFANCCQDDEDDEDDEEDVEELRREAMEIASRLVICGYKPDAVANLDFLARGSYHYVWLVTLLTVRRLR